MLQHMEAPSAKALLSAAASAAATAVLIRSVTRDFIPHEVQHFFRQKLVFLFSSMSSQITITIHESEGLYMNQLFHSAELYLGNKISPSTQGFRAFLPPKETEIILFRNKNQQVIDVFNGVLFQWRRVTHQREPTVYGDGGGRSSGTMYSSHFELSFHKKHRDMVLSSYLPQIVSEAKMFVKEKKTLKIHTLRYDQMFGKSVHPWASANLDHPATFETLAMDPEVKKTIMDDLELFVRRKDFYRRVGKAWKRGYLLFWPPGTGKSSLIAAIANYLKFDIYDLELTALTCNSELRKMLIATANRSILVVEDIDCSIDLENRKKQMSAENPSLHQPQKITLSGLLNFIDGLWSSCGDERIIILTTNHKERLDQALLRPGRMDVHIHMSYCTPCGFNMLASNYLGITEHPLFAEVELLMPTARVTPAEVGEQLMKTEDPESALKGLVEFLKAKEENELKANSPEKASEESVIVEESEEDDAQAGYGDL